MENATFLDDAQRHNKLSGTMQLKPLHAKKGEKRPQNSKQQHTAHAAAAASTSKAATATAAAKAAAAAAAAAAMARQETLEKRSCMMRLWKPTGSDLQAKDH